jgi:hypothetical protein
VAGAENRLLLADQVGVAALRADLVGVLVLLGKVIQAVLEQTVEERQTLAAVVAELVLLVVMAGATQQVMVARELHLPFLARQ